MKIRITENQYNNLKNRLVESTIKDFISKLKKNDIVSFKIDNKDAKLIVFDVTKKIFKNQNPKHKNKLYYFDSVANGKLKIRIADVVNDKFKLNNPKIWDLDEYDIQSPIQLIRGNNVVDTIDGPTNSNQQGNQQGGEQDGENVNADNVDYNKLLDDPLLRQSFYKAPNLFGRLLNVIKGNKAREGKGIIKLDDLTRDLRYSINYHTNDVPNFSNFIKNKNANFKYNNQNYTGKVINNGGVVKLDTGSLIFRIDKTIDINNHRFLTTVTDRNNKAIDNDDNPNNNILIMIPSSGDDYGYIVSNKK